MWALHYIYLQRINQELDQFRGQWNHHGLRMEHHQSPLQLFVTGSLSQINTGLTAMQYFQNPSNNLSSFVSNVDSEEPQMPAHMPFVDCPLQESDLRLLKAHIDPLSEDGSQSMIHSMAEKSFARERSMSRLLSYKGHEF